MVSSYTANKRLEKPANGDYVDTWQIPVNGDMDVIDQALGGTTFLNATGGSAILSVSEYRAMAISVSGAMSGNVVYTIPSGVGGVWIVYNNTTDSVGTGPWTVTFASGGGGTSLALRRGFNTTIYSDGTNIRLADNSATAGGTNTNIQYNELSSFAGSSNFVYDYNNVRVGIGISNPAVRLQVVGGRTSLSANNEAFALQVNNGTTLNGPFIGSTGADTLVLSTSGGTEQFRMTAAGNFGFGTNNPTRKMQIVGTGATFGINGGAGELSLAPPSAGLSEIDVAGANALRLNTNSVERVRITSAGLVGIGTASPGCSLEVAGGIRARGGAPGSSGANNNGYAFSGGSGDNDSGMFSTADGQVEFYTNAVERVRVTSAGRVGVGITSPGHQLSVAGAIQSTSGGFVFPDGSVQTSATFARTVNAGQGISVTSTTGDITVFVPNGGINAAMLQGGVAVANIGYQPVSRGGDTMSGTLTVPALTVSSSSNYINMADTNWGTRYIHHNDGLIGFLTSAGNWAHYVDNGGNFVAVGNVTAYSDARLKEDLTSLGDALEVVQSLRGYRYTRKDTGQKEIGLIAQEVEAMLPELVMNTGEYKSLAYDRMVAVLVEAVKTLAARIEILEQGNAHTV